MKNKIRYILITFIFFTIITGNLYGQSKYTSGIYLKSIQADFTSLIFINGASVYSDLDFLKSISKPRSFGLRFSLEIADFNSITGSGDEGFPIRNLAFSMRITTRPSSIQMNGLISFVKTNSISEAIVKRDGNNLRIELEASRYFFNDKLGIKFKFHLPLINFYGERTGSFIGIGIVIGYLKE